MAQGRWRLKRTMLGNFILFQSKQLGYYQQVYIRQIRLKRQTYCHYLKILDSILC